MTKIETSSQVLRGGIRDRIGSYDFVKLFVDFLDTPLYTQVQLQPHFPTIDYAYTDNQTFWHDSLKGLHFEGSRISFQGFHLTEWIPSAPGRYFTSEAVTSRRDAQKYLLHGKEYLPWGKGQMILGGIGSVRLGAKIIESTTTYFLGASSTGVSHQGIPVALPESEYRKVIPVIKKCGGCVADLVGSLRILPADLSIIRYDRKIAKYCLFADNVEVIRPSSEEELLATVAIEFTRPPLSWDRKLNFTEDEHTVRFPKLWSFCSFRPGSDKRSLEMAIDWLKDYAARYSGMDNPPILNDFDEHYEHFDNPIEFPISRLFSNDINTNRLFEYGRIYNIIINTERIGELIMGKTYKDIRNSTIVDDSIVIKSFNKIQKDFGQDTAKALLQVAEEIAKSHNTEAAELFAAFNKELQKPEPS